MGNVFEFKSKEASMPEEVFLADVQAAIVKQEGQLTLACAIGILECIKDSMLQDLAESLGDYDE